MPVLQLKIRQAVQADIESLVSLRACLLDGASEASYVSRNAEESLSWKAAYSRWLSQVLDANAYTRIIVADRDGETIGCATGVIDRRPPAPDCMSGCCGWVQSVVVSPQWRRHGIAEQLMCDLLHWFVDRGACKVVLEATSGAGGLYRKLGFTPNPESLLTYAGSRL